MPDLSSWDMRNGPSSIIRESLRWLVTTAAISAAIATTAAESTAPLPDESRWRLGAAVGYGQRSNPLALSDDIPIIVDLDIGWFGDRWFFDNGDVGLTVRDGNSCTINVIGRLNSDRVFFSLTNSEFVTVFDPVGQPVSELVAVPDRDFAIEAGLELLADGRWGYLQVDAFRDVSNTHGGYEIYANYGLGILRNRWLFEPSLGASYKSSKLNDYYWGVRPDEANILFPPYSAGAGINRHARFKATYQIDRHWAFVAILEYERLNSEAATSPIAEEGDVRGAYAGLRYEF